MENIILAELFRNKKFTKKVMPHLHQDYFDSFDEKLIFRTIKAYIAKYNKLPTFSSVMIGINNRNDINESQYSTIQEKIEGLKSFDEKNDLTWLVDETEKFCQNKALENAIIESADIVQSGKNIYTVKGLIETALQVNFDRNIGIEFFSDKGIKERFEYYNRKAIKYKTHLKNLNGLTGGGLEPKTLNVFFGDTHVGKTMTLSALTAGYVLKGYDVLYITLEMSQENISKLIDANLLDIKINDIAETEENTFVSKLNNLKKNEVGRLFVREFPTGQAGTANIQALLEDLKYKKSFIPQIIVVDYINLMRCDRYSDGNSYTIVKGISEELRGLMVSGNYCGISATQSNRSGAKSSDIDTTDTAESYGLPQTVDLLIGMMTSDTLKEQNLLIWKSLKNRIYGITGVKFPVKTNFAYAQLLDSDNEYDNLINQNSTKLKTAMEKMGNKDKLKSLKVNNNTNGNDMFDNDDLFDWEN